MNHLADPGKMAELFGVQRPAITKHLQNIFDSAELDEQVVRSILEHTTAHGAIPGKTQIRTVKYYNLDAIIRKTLLTQRRDDATKSI